MIKRLPLLLFLIGNLFASQSEIKLNVRKFKPAIDQDKYDTELNSHQEFLTQKIDLQKIALILIDVWKTHPNNGWLKRANKITETKIVPLLKFARKNKFKIFHAPHNRLIADQAKPTLNEINLDNVGLADTKKFDKYLKNKGIDTLIYAGFASNWCILFRPTGMIKMRQLGYRVILIRDCTIGFETPETLKGEWANKTAINIIECQLGVTTTLQDIYQAFNGGK